VIQGCDSRGSVESRALCTKAHSGCRMSLRTQSGEYRRSAKIRKDTRDPPRPLAHKSTGKSPHWGRQSIPNYVRELCSPSSPSCQTSMSHMLPAILRCRNVYRLPRLPYSVCPHPPSRATLGPHSELEGLESTRAASFLPTTDRRRPPHHLVDRAQQQRGPTDRALFHSLPHQYLPRFSRGGGKAPEKVEVPVRVREGL
jgi:hypothetical protein